MKPGDTVTVHSLSGRADLNGKQAKLLYYAKDAARWAVELMDGESVRVREQNLKECHEGVMDAERNDDEDAGVYVKANLNGHDMAIDPARLKRDFDVSCMLHRITQNFVASKMLYNTICPGLV